MSYYKIGFHTGASGNTNNLDTYMQDLDAEGLPFILKSADEYSWCRFGVELATASNVDHMMVFRLSTAGQNDGFDYDVPNYAATPEIAAASHWQATVAKLPSDFNKLVWIEPINEVDKNRADWLGQFAKAIAELANADDYKVALFGWSSGEPEPENWREPGMLDYLQYCADHLTEAAVSLHEYSYDLSLKTDYPWLVGRFMDLFAACDENDISRPTTLITEFGWRQDQIPANVDDAMADLAWANALYAAYPEIKGAGIWYLGSGFGDIANQVQKLILPVRDVALTYEGEPPAITTLVNPGFETLLPDGNDVYRVVEGQAPELITVGNIVSLPGWTPWFQESAEYVQTESRQSDHPNPPRMRTGQFGRMNFTTNKRHHAGWLQQVTAEPGNTYQFSAWAHAWSNHLDPSGDFPHPSDPHWSEGAGYDPFFALVGDYEGDGTQQGDAPLNFEFYVGIHPAGGLNPLDPSVVWGRGAHIYNVFAQIPLVEVTASAPIITVFIAMKTLYAFKHNDGYVDDATLVVVEDPEPPDPPPTDETLEEYFWRRSVERQKECGISLNPDALLQSKLFSLDLTPVESELWETYPGDNEVYAYQAGESVPGTDSRQVAIAGVPDPGDPWVADSFTDPGDVPPDPDPDPDPPGNPLVGLVLGVPFRMPFTLTSAFNAPRDYANGLHEGGDYDIFTINPDSEEPVLCLYDGEVVFSGNNDGAYGNYIIVESENNGSEFFVWYAHLDELYVVVGDQVLKGQELAELGGSGGVWSEHVHINLQVPGYGLDGYVVTDVVDPDPYIQRVSGTLTDLLPYLKGDDRLFEVKVVMNDGSEAQQRHQTQLGDSTIFYQTKGNEVTAEWEEMWSDGTYLYRGTDTSPGEADGQPRYYQLLENGQVGSKWFPRYAKEGDIFERNPLVNFHNKDTCALLSSGYQNTWLKFEKIHPTKTFFTGLIIDDVVEMHWLSAPGGTILERYFYALNYGLVGWEGSIGQSAISEEHAPGTRPDNKRETIGCLE